MSPKGLALREASIDSLRSDDKRHLILLLQHLGLEEAILGFPVSGNRKMSPMTPPLSSSSDIDGQRYGGGPHSENAPPPADEHGSSKLPYLGLGQHLMSFSRLASSIVPLSLKTNTPSATAKMQDTGLGGRSEAPDGPQPIGTSSGDKTMGKQSMPTPRFARVKADSLCSPASVAASTTTAAVNGSGGNLGMSGRQEVMPLLAPPVPRPLSISQLYYVQVG
jgi:hypothetical protein